MGLEDPEVQSYYSSSDSEFNSSSNEVFSNANTEELCQKIQILSGSLVESLDASSILVSENKKLYQKCDLLSTKLDEAEKAKEHAINQERVELCRRQDAAAQAERQEPRPPGAPRSSIPREKTQPPQP